MGYIAKNLGLRIKEIRERNGLTQQMLAELINMETSNLSKIERGIQMPKEESLEKIINILKIEAKELFDFEHMQPKEQLAKNITGIINNSSFKELQTYYKIINSVKELIR